MFHELSLLDDRLLYTVFRKLPYRLFFRLRRTCKSLNSFAEKHYQIELHCPYLLSIESHSIGGQEQYNIVIFKKNGEQHRITDPQKDLQCISLKEITLNVINENATEVHWRLPARLSCKTLILHNDYNDTGIGLSYYFRFRELYVNECGPEYLATITKFCRHVHAETCVLSKMDYETITKFETYDTRTPFYDLEGLLKHFTECGTGTLRRLYMSRDTSQQLSYANLGMSSLYSYFDQITNDLYCKTILDDQVLLMAVTLRGYSFELLSEDAFLPTLVGRVHEHSRKTNIPLDASIIFEKLACSVPKQYSAVLKAYIDVINDHWN